MSEEVRPETPFTVTLLSVTLVSWSIFCDDAKVAVETGVVAAGPEKDGWGSCESALI